MIYSSFLFILLISCGGINSQNIDSIEQNIGHFLFFDTRLSHNNTKSCASCHDPKFAFTDAYRTSVSPSGENLLHNAPSLLNIQNQAFFDWNNINAKSYKSQIQRPLYNHSPLELGLDLHWEKFKNYLLFTASYKNVVKQYLSIKNDSLSKTLIEKCLIAYLKKLKISQAPIDDFLNGNEKSISIQAQRGFQLFVSSKLKCVSCHPPPNFTLNDNEHSLEEIFRNIALYNVNNKNAYPNEDKGLIIHTTQIKDEGKFRIPSLRNVAITAPYMHDGSVDNLTEVIKIYARGGRNIISGKYKGDGAKNIYKDALIQGFEISEMQIQDLLVFLHTLGDTSYVHKDFFMNPFQP